MNQIAQRLLAAAALAALPDRGGGAGEGRQRLQLVGLHRRVDPRRLHQGDRHQGRLRRLRFQRDPGDQAARRRLRLRRRRADRPQFLARQIQAGVFQKLDKSKLPEPRQHVGRDRRSGSQTYDPGNEYSINYMWGTTGIGYNVDKIKERCPTRRSTPGTMSSSRRSSSKLADCGVYVLDAPDDMHPGGAELSRPRSRTRRTRPRLAQGRGALLKRSGRISASSTPPNTSTRWPMATSAWPSAIRATCSRRATARPKPTNGVESTMSIPKEGAEMWFDSLPSRPTRRIPTRRTTSSTT